MPADSYYPDMENETMDEGQPTPPGPPPKEKEEPAENSALVPLSVFPGETPSPGDVCKFRVVHVYEDEAEIEYVKEDGMDEDEEGEEEGEEGEGERGYGMRPGRPREGMAGAMDRLEMLRE